MAAGPASPSAMGSDLRTGNDASASFAQTTACYLYHFPSNTSYGGLKDSTIPAALVLTLEEVEAVKKDLKTILHKNPAAKSISKAQTWEGLKRRLPRLCRPRQIMLTSEQRQLRTARMVSFVRCSTGLAQM
ncbi:hypothetical protein J1614_004308 [Plenodomus biglobosus]|nr:hypothetical protein J1614_004308 [Plenodomus biglobosus]